MLLIIAASSLSPVYAQGFFDSIILPDSFFYNFKIFGENLHEAITFNPQAKAELKIQHADERTKEIEVLMQRNEVIPDFLQENHKIKLQEAKDIIANADDKSLFDKLKTQLKNTFGATDLNVIRTEFMELRFEEDEATRLQLAQELDSKINQPTVNITCLGTLSSLEIANAIDPYAELQNQCIILTIISIDKIMQEFQ